jgi:hypothetical protein
MLVDEGCTFLTACSQSATSTSFSGRIGEQFGRGMKDGSILNTSAQVSLILDLY